MASVRPAQRAEAPPAPAAPARAKWTFPKVCACGRKFHAAAWRALPYVGTIRAAGGLVSRARGPRAVAVVPDRVAVSFRVVTPWAFRMPQRPTTLRAVRRGPGPTPRKCTGGESNPYALRRRNLNPLRMPISPPVRAVKRCRGQLRDASVDEASAPRGVDGRRCASGETSDGGRVTTRGRAPRSSSRTGSCGARGPRRGHA